MLKKGINTRESNKCSSCSHCAASILPGCDRLSPRSHTQQSRGGYTTRSDRPLVIESLAVSANKHVERWNVFRNKDKMHCVLNGCITTEPTVLEVCVCIFGVVDLTRDGRGWDVSVASSVACSCELFQDYQPWL